MNALTVKELKLRQAQLDERAERLRQEWRKKDMATTASIELGKEVKALQQRADDYAAIIRVAEGMS